jgi:hypothetical protein
MSEIDFNSIHTSLIGFTKRAEKATDESLVATFVDSAPLFALLSTENNQVIYGRRGTGKTHALKVLSEHVQKKDGIPIFLDMRTVGSNGSIYADQSRPLAERASVLLSDALAALMNEFYEIAIGIIDSHPHPAEVTRRLDTLQNAISTVKIGGEVNEELTDSNKQQIRSDLGTNVGLTDGKVSGNLTYNKGNATEAEQQKIVRRAGQETVHLTFGTIGAALSDMVAIL